MSAVEASSVSVKTMAGIRYGSLVALTDPVGQLVECRCDCGTVCSKHAWHVRRGNIQSCGCKQLAAMRAARLKSGARRSDDQELRRFYQAWCGMRARCNNKNHKDFKYYGGRGIAVCSEWDSFEAFKRDMWPRPPGMTLDRKDTNQGYSLQNCRWATAIQQRHNRRDSK